MEKTIIIHLNQTVFHIEEKAYEKLQNYLNSIKKHFQKTGDADEIVADIEASAASHFSEKINAKKKVITLADIDELIASMGTVDDISGEEEEKNEKTDASVPPLKKLFRDTENKVLGGVASGIAAYFNFDPIILRILLVVFLLIPNFGGSILIIYIILWFIMPEAKTTTDKMMMRGEPVNISTIENAVIEKSEKMQTKITRFSSELFEGSMKIFKKLFSATSFIFGLIIVVSMALGIAGLTSVAVSVLTNTAIFFPGVAMNTILPGNLFPLSVFLVYLAGVIPIVFIMLLGVSLMRRKSAFSILSGLTMLFVWVAALAGIAAMAINLGPKYQARTFSFDNPQSVSNTIVNINHSQEFKLSGFTGINVSGVKELKVVRSKDFKVVVFGEQNQIDKTGVVVKNGNLVITNEDHGQFCIGFCGTNYQRPVNITVYMPVLESLIITGNVKTNVIDLDGRQLKLHSIGNANTTINGKLEGLSIDSTGNSHIDTSELKAKSVYVKTIGNSQIMVKADTSLEVSSVGDSTVKYIGNPTITQKNIGNGRLEKIEISPTPTLIQKTN